MQNDKYCYPNTNVLINKLNITDKEKLLQAEEKLTVMRLLELQKHPIVGGYNFKHLKAIHKYIFQDLYEWAGETRTVEIGKGNIFCLTVNIDNYADYVFSKYHPECRENKNNYNKFIKTFAKNYGDLNALHPFREGNGRTQREFARLICMDCGYDFDLSDTTHQEMLNASIQNFNTGDTRMFEIIFSRAIKPFQRVKDKVNMVKILSSDDLKRNNSKTKEDYLPGKY